MKTGLSSAGHSGPAPIPDKGTDIFSIFSIFELLILCSIESDEFMLFYSGIEDSEKELRLTCIKRKDKFIKSINLLGSISYPATGGSYTNIISSDGKIISSFGTH